MKLKLKILAPILIFLGYFFAAKWYLTSNIFHAILCGVSCWACINVFNKIKKL